MRMSNTSPFLRTFWVRYGVGGGCSATNRWKYAGMESFSGPGTVRSQTRVPSSSLAA